MVTDLQLHKAQKAIDSITLLKQDTVQHTGQQLKKRGLALSVDAADLLTADIHQAIDQAFRAELDSAAQVVSDYHRQPCRQRILKNPRTLSAVGAL